MGGRLPRIREVPARARTDVRVRSGARRRCRRAAARRCRARTRCSSMSGHGSSRSRVVVGDLALGRGVVVARALVDDVGHVGQDAEAVREADRDVELAHRSSSSSIASHSPKSASRAAGRRRRRRSARARSARAWPGRARSGSASRAACPRREREWLSWTKCSSTPCSAHTFSRNVSVKKPRSSPNTFGSSRTRPSRRGFESASCGGEG